VLLALGERKQHTKHQILERKVVAGIAAHAPLLVTLCDYCQVGGQAPLSGTSLAGLVS
jgi:hypothetical protein